MNQQERRKETGTRDENRRNRGQEGRGNSRSSGPPRYLLHNDGEVRNPRSLLRRTREHGRGKGIFEVSCRAARRPGGPGRLEAQHIEDVKRQSLLNNTRIGQSIQQPQPRNSRQAQGPDLRTRSSQPPKTRNMARKSKSPNVHLAQPDRSGPDPSQQTLLDIAARRGVLKEAEEEEEPLVGRVGESILWSVSLAMLHFTLDVLVSHQYAVDVEWPKITVRGLQALPGEFSSPRGIRNLIRIVIFLLLYSFHPHPTPSILLPPLPKKYQPLLHQVFFFVSAVSAGNYLIYITNEHGSYAVMKQAPPLGCLWIWSVIELDVLWATASLLCCGAFLKLGGFSYL